MACKNLTKPRQSAGGCATSCSSCSRMSCCQRMALFSSSAFVRARRASALRACVSHRQTVDAGSPTSRAASRIEPVAIQASSACARVSAGNVAIGHGTSLPRQQADPRRVFFVKQGMTVDWVGKSVGGRREFFTKIQNCG